MEKLNLQAHQNAMFNTDEYVLEAILTFDKFEVHNALIWANTLLIRCIGIYDLYHFVHL